MVLTSLVFLGNEKVSWGPCRGHTCQSSERRGAWSSYQLPFGLEGVLSGDWLSTHAILVSFDVELSFFDCGAQNFQVIHPEDPYSDCLSAKQVQYSNCRNMSAWQIVQVVGKPFEYWTQLCPVFKWLLEKPDQLYNRSKPNHCESFFWMVGLIMPQIVWILPFENQTQKMVTVI